MFLNLIFSLNVIFKVKFSIVERTGDIDVEISLIEVTKNKTLLDVARGLLQRWFYGKS